ncbi:alpha/beta hydrolase [Cellulomonas sp. PhB143]|uniref:alpha/beta hydrolase n=1 Tax=Cellulomonas sp. PhB143 TaxID=2485186 RepID=UPI000FBA7730|nr:alpha/beta hydrolase [Cellulomonas sp. PhB143]ROS74495.1 hypothetical protein EDF32_2242 [Cellulomonas sp. PhB143]
MSDHEVQVLAGDPARVATVLPGSGYTAAAPLLAYPSTALHDAGWTVRQVHWALAPSGDAGWARAREVYAATLRDAVRAAPGAAHVVVAKSLGTLAMPAALELGMVGAWLTPVLDGSLASEVRAATAGLAAQHLLAGGTADAMWDGALARASRAKVLEVDGADHALEVPGAWRRSLDALAEITAAVELLAASVAAS